VDSIGKYLKEKRESLGLSVEEVSNDTKLKIYFINQIESDDFAAMGDIGFTKIMIITYCRALSADEDLVQKRLNNLFDKPSEPPIKINTVTPVKPIILPSNMVWFFSLFILIVALAAAFYFLYQQNPKLLDPNAIKNSFQIAEKKDTKDIPIVYAEPDTNVANQIRLVTEMTSVEPVDIAKTTEPLGIVESVPLVAVTDTEVVPPSTPFMPPVTTTPTTTPKKNNLVFISDKTDYASDLIFGGKVSPLNPEL